jgi:aminoglycoside phosphotransferase (APT) family kinase protein
MVMHDDQLQITPAMARALIGDQFPEWRRERVTAIDGPGTTNAIYRIGDRLTARFPLRAAAAETVGRQLRAEAAALTELSAVCPFPTPEPIAIGAPSAGYPLPWAVQTWLPGEIATPRGLESSSAFANDLVRLIRSFRECDTRGRRFEGTGRGGELTDHDGWVAICLAQSRELLEVDRLERIWQRMRNLPRSHVDVMSHGDLIPANLLVEGDRLVGVLDGGGFGPADPALDLVSAWHLLDGDRREQVRDELGCDSVEWQRGAAWAFEQALGLVWYYRASNPGMSALGRSTLGRILDDVHL